MYYSNYGEDYSDMIDRRADEIYKNIPHNRAINKVYNYMIIFFVIIIVIACLYLFHARQSLLI